MKKSSLVVTMLGTISGVLFALGMCMALIPQWNAFKPDIVLGVVGLVLAVVTVIVWRKMEHKAPVHLSGKAVLTILVGIVGRWRSASACALAWCGATWCSAL